MKNGIINFEINTKICYKDKVFILNKPFESSYTDVEGNIAHEIIDYIKIDINKVFVYNNHWSHCPDFRKAEIELEIEAEMKDKYDFVEYSKISRFIDDVNKKNHFKGFPFEGDVQDVTNAFDKFGCQNKSKLFEQFFLESI